MSFYSTSLFPVEKHCIEKKALIQYSFVNGVWVKGEEMAGSAAGLKTNLGIDEDVNIIKLYNPTQNQTHWAISIQSFYSLYLDVKEVFDIFWNSFGINSKDIN